MIYGIGVSPRRISAIGLACLMASKQSMQISTTSSLFAWLTLAWLACCWMTLNKYMRAYMARRRGGEGKGEWVP